MPSLGAFASEPSGLEVMPTGRPLEGSKGQVSIVSLIKRTEPSPIKTFKPPGCMLDAELCSAAVAPTDTRSIAFGG